MRTGESISYCNLANHRKQLQGVEATPSICSLYEECLCACKSEARPLLDSKSPQKYSNSNHANAVLSPLSLEEAVSCLVSFGDLFKQKKASPLPLKVIRAMNVVLKSLDESKEAQLEKALRQTHLAFTPPLEVSPDQNKKFHQRMERLRLQNEESKYYRLTSNIAGNRSKGDEITTKSMTYAASIGLNMIVAPLSFGVFMFFFSGPILNFLFQRVQPSHPGAVDIRKVIIGVISGVAMLFIEMLLFVIRTHEFDRGLAKKQRKAGTSVKPFGDYSAKSKKTFESNKKPQLK